MIKKSIVYLLLFLTVYALPVSSSQAGFNVQFGFYDGGCYPRHHYHYYPHYRHYYRHGYHRHYHHGYYRHHHYHHRHHYHHHGHHHHHHGW